MLIQFSNCFVQGSLLREVPCQIRFISKVPFLKFLASLKVQVDLRFHWKHFQQCLSSLCDHPLLSLRLLLMYLALMNWIEAILTFIEATCLFWWPYQRKWRYLCKGCGTRQWKWGPCQKEWSYCHNEWGSMMLSTRVGSIWESWGPFGEKWEFLQKGPRGHVKCKCIMFRVCYLL